MRVMAKFAGLIGRGTQSKIDFMLETGPTECYSAICEEGDKYSRFPGPDDMPVEDKLEKAVESSRPRLAFVIVD